jgi:broad specificity phosphatase PhoE
MRLYWVRHGQMELRASAVSDARQIDRLFNQEREGSLSPLGRREARAVASRLRDERLDAIYASPLLRARETAEVTAEALGMHVEITPAITELRTGRLPEDGLAARYVRAMLRAPLRAELKRAILGGTLIPIYFHAWRRERTVGGETPAMLDARVSTFLAELEARYREDARVALFAHGYLIFTLVRSLARSPRARLALVRRPYIPNGSITEMTLERGRLGLRRYADDRHLRDLRA